MIEAELKELLAKATLGPWSANCSHLYAPDGAIIGTINNPGSKETDYPLVANRDLIVAAVNALPALLATIEQQRAEVERLREASFQSRVQPWMLECFNAEIAADITERCDRFIEEDFELVQALGHDPTRIDALKHYVFNRPAGEPSQEVGGVMVTLAALCLATGLNMHEAGETELARIWTKIDKIRAKQAAKPTGSALPQELTPVEPCPKCGATGPCKSPAGNSLPRQHAARQGERT